MAPRKATKEEIVNLLSEGMKGSSLPPSGGVAIVPLQASEIVTYPALALVMENSSTKLDALSNLMVEKFKSLEDLSRERQGQIAELKAALDKEKTANVKFKIASLVAVVGFLADALLRFVAK